MVRQIFGDTSFGDAEVLCEFRLDGFTATPRGASASHIGDGHAKSLASLDVIIRGQVRVRKNPHAGAGRSAIRIIKFCWGAGEQAAKIHFELCKARSQAGITVAAAKTRCGNFRGFLGR